MESSAEKTVSRARNTSAGDPGEGDVEKLRYQVIDKDTGEVFRIDEIENHINLKAYTLFPSRDELAQKLAGPAQRTTDSDDEESIFTQKGIGARVSALGNMFGMQKKKEDGQKETIEGQIRVYSTKRETPDFADLKVVQSIQAHDGPIWTMKFSVRGDYLASAGQSGIILVWAIGTESNPSTQPQTAAAAEADKDTTTTAAGEEATTEGAVQDDISPGADVVKLLNLTPHRRFGDHSADVIDLSWNKENFLLSASIDKTVRLWHTARRECLHVYLHVDCVTSVDFHPKLDHLFITGNFDKKLRVWNVTDGRVKEWANTPDMITAAGFNPEGTMAVAGLYRGKVFFYQTEGMKYYTQVECRNRHGALKGGKKVTGLCYDVSKQSQSPGFSEQILVTTNDSRLRLYQTEDYSMLCKYKGLLNDHMQIKATFSEDGAYVISGSENGNVYLWRSTILHASPVLHLDGLKKDRNAAHESFVATEMGGSNPPIVSVAVFVPGAAVENALKANSEVLARAEGKVLNKMIITADYGGRIRVFQRHCLTKGDNVT